MFLLRFTSAASPLSCAADSFFFHTFSSRKRADVDEERNTRLNNPTVSPSTYFMKSFELITPVPEGSDRVDVEGVLPLTDGGEALLQAGDSCLLVGLLAVI